MNSSNEAIRRVWPMMTDEKIDRANGDTDALVTIIARESGHTVETVRHRLDLLERTLGPKSHYQTPGGTNPVQ